MLKSNALEILHNGTVIPAIPLALDSHYQFNPNRQRTLIRYYLNSNVGGLAVAVHTTQFEIRDPKIALLEPVLRIASEEISAYQNKTGKTIVKIAGVCGPTQQAIREATLAYKLGFDAVLLSPGNLNDLNETELLTRSEAVAKIMPVIGFYLQNSVGGRVLSFDYWRQLANIPNVVAIKAAPFNRYQTLDLVRGVVFSERCNEVALYTGNDDNIVIDLLTKFVFNVNGKEIEKRFVGGLLGHWSVWTHTVVKMYSLIKQCHEQDFISTDLLTLASQVTDCNGAFFDVKNNFKGCIAGIHEVLHRQGLLEGIWCLNKEETLSPGQLEEINRVYDLYPHLNDDAFIKENVSNWL